MMRHVALLAVILMATALPAHPDNERTRTFRVVSTCIAVNDFVDIGWSLATLSDAAPRVPGNFVA